MFMLKALVLALDIEAWLPKKVGGLENGPLTPEQKTKFQELRQKFNEETAPLREVNPYQEA